MSGTNPKLVGRLITDRHTPIEFEVIVFTFLLILFENFPIVNIHQKNMEWKIQQNYSLNFNKKEAQKSAFSAFLAPIIIFLYISTFSKGLRIKKKKLRV